MDEKIKKNPLNQIFKLNPKNLISEEIENPSNISLLYEYLKNKSNNINNKIKIVVKLTEIIKLNRGVSSFLTKYENKSLYIFLFDIYLNEKNSEEFRISIISLIRELISNISISKEVYEYIFQKLSQEYRKDKNFISDIVNSSKLFNEYFYDLLFLLNSTFVTTKKNEENPRNYFSCFGNNSFTLNFNEKKFIFGKCLCFIINFKITKSKLMQENSELFGQCSLLKLNFEEENKVFDIELKYPFFIIIKDGKKVYTAKVCPIGEWINLTIILELLEPNLKAYFFTNGESSLLPIKIKNIKLKNNDIIKSINFFNNFYGEVTSISMFSLNQNDSINIFSQILKYFSDKKIGFWKGKLLNNFINFIKGITYIDKTINEEKKENLLKTIIFIFTPFNYDKNKGDIVEDFLNKYILILNGNIRNQKFQNYQKKLMKICDINNFLPIAEMFLIYQNQLLNEKNFILYLNIISKIVLGKKNILFMNDSKFFQLLSLSIENIPNNIFNENVLNEFDNIGKIIILQKVNNFCSNYFNNILLNEKIILKYTKDLQIKVWDLIFKLCLLEKEKIGTIIETKKICIILRYYDRNRYNKICCKYHFDMYKKEFIGDINIMEPNLNEILINIQKIIDIIISKQNPENIICLFKLLMLDLSPCFIKLILKSFINVFDKKNKDEELKKKILLELIKIKYDIIIINTFIHSLPDVRYDLLILMNYIFLILIKMNKISEFSSFEKMIKTCLLPTEIFYMNKIINNSNNNQNDFDALAEFKKNNENKTNDDNKNINNNIYTDKIIIDKKEINEKKEIEKNKEQKNESKNESKNKNENKSVYNSITIPPRATKSNSIYILASKFDNKNKSNAEKKSVKIDKIKVGEKTKLIAAQIEEKISKQKSDEKNKQQIIKGKKTEKNSNQENTKDNLNMNNIININKNQQSHPNKEKEEKANTRKSTLNLTQKNDEIKNEYIYFKEGESIYYNNIIQNETLIFRDVLFDLYINSLYILFLKWSLGIPISYSISSSKELFTSLKQQKYLSKNNCITFINYFELLFSLNNEINNINFTYRLLKSIERLIQLPENSYIILTNNKIYSSLIEITFNYYYKIKNGNCNEIEKEIFTIGKNNVIYILINSLNYYEGEVKNPPMKNLETIFLLGDKIILGDINDNKKVNSVFDFIYDLLFDILNQYKNEFGDKIKQEFEFNFNPLKLKDNIYFKNYSIYLTSIYNFCFHYKVDHIIKNSDIDAFFSISLNINIPDIFISGMRLDNTKGNNISEYWKDFYLIEDILNKINYIFKNDYIKKKIYGDNYKAKKNENKEKKENNLNYDKYNVILKELMFNNDKKDLFKKELFLLCYYETNINDIEIIIPLIRIISIGYICILSIIKDLNDLQQFARWIKEYTNLLKFVILSSINLNKNTSSSLEIKAFTKIQNICFDVIGAGLCFLNNLLECATIGQEIISKYINKIFLLCFSILKINFDGNKNNKGLKFFLNKTPPSDIASKAVLILFNDYIKDKDTKTPFLNAMKLEKSYLNPSFKIVDLINENAFYEAFFENKNLKGKLFEKYYSLNTYKITVDNRYKLIRNLEDKIDYSYQIKILGMLPLYEKELLKYSNNIIKNRRRIKQIYTKIKKKLFSWNGLWSNRKLFYGDNNIIKYKVKNHYTKNLMRPLLSPILDINYYLPEFTQFNKEKLFHNNANSNGQNNDKFNYDLILDFDKLLKLATKNNKNDFNKIKNNDIKENIKRVSGLLQKPEENKINYIEYLYKPNSRLYEFLKVVSRIDLGIKNIEEEFNDDMENDSNYILKEKDRKDTIQTQRTSSSTIVKKNEENISPKKSYDNLKYGKLKKEKYLNNKEYKLCCLVKASYHIKGIIYIKENKLNFKLFPDIFSENDDDYDKERGTCFGSYFNQCNKDKNLDKISIKFEDIKWIFKRKYYYKNSAIEILTLSNKSYFFYFKDEESKDFIINETIKMFGKYHMIINDIKELPNGSYSKNNITNDRIIGYQNNSNPLISKKSKLNGKNRIKISKIINRWKNWEFSNFELLMILNYFSNRSYNDITQYPVLPWILTNYEDPLKKEQIKEDVQNSEDNNSIDDYSYRNLSEPMGMLTINEESIKRKTNYLSVYKILKQDKEMKPYIYGCNYSNPTYVSNYLIRLFPFTQICIEIQVTGFDNPRRLFTSIDKAFKNASSQSIDIREIIPEFFYFPEMFINLNNLNLGKYDENTLVNDAKTPCDNNPYKFIGEFRNILESQKVSYNINNWIDLIFGYKAKGKEAELAKNLFTEQSYQEDININQIKDKDNYLRYGEFGLIPNQLFNIKEFPPKEKIENIKKNKPVIDSLSNLKKFRCKKNTTKSNKLKDDLPLLSVVNISQENLILFYDSNIIVEKKITYSIFDKEYSEEIIDIKKQMKQTPNKMSNLNKNNIQIIRNGKIIIIGGYYDGKITVFDLENNNVNSINDISYFNDESPITTIHVDEDEEFLFLGNSLGNICILNINEKNIKDWKVKCLINDHLHSIISINSNNELNVWASATINGYINIYTLPLCKLTKSFKIKTNKTCNNIFIIDFPSPSIIIICQDEIYLYSINGFKFNYFKELSDIISPIIIKDFLGRYFLSYIVNNKNIFIMKIPDLSIQTKIENDNDICYLCPGIEMKVFYAISKNGTLIDIFIYDNKKGIEENYVIF